MSRTALALVLVAASASAASAGGFVGLGIGTGAATSGDMPFNENGRTGRLEVGYRVGHFSVEGMASKYDLVYEANTWGATTLGLAGKVNFALGDRFEAFGRVGLQRTSITRSDLEVGGDGFLVGGGFEYRLPVAVAQVSVFVDYSIVRSSVDTWNAMDLSLTSRIWTLGATLSF